MIIHLNPFMRFQKRQQINWFYKLPVLVLYLLFFTVQLFFNHDVSSRPFSSVQLTQDSKQSSASSIKEAPAKDPLKHKVRLNKRYEPSVIPPVLFQGMVLAVCYASPVTLGVELCQFYPQVFLSACSLRGPPVVA